MKRHTDEGLIRKLAKEFAWVERQCGMGFDDLLQYGRIGVERARATFDPAKGKWTTYAGWWIRHFMRRGAWMDARTVRIPLGTAAQVAEIRAIWASDGPSLAELGRSFGVHPRTIKRIVSGKSWG